MDATFDQTAANKRLATSRYALFNTAVKGSARAVAPVAAAEPVRAAAPAPEKAAAPTSQAMPAPTPQVAASAEAPAKSAGRGLDEPFLQLDLGQLGRHLTSRIKLIVLCMVLGVVATLVFALITPARYTVTSEILIDPTDLRVVQDDLYTTNEQRDALLLNVESKMRVLVSGNVLFQTISALNLDTDPEFVPAGGFSLSALFGGQAAESTPDLIALRTLTKQVQATRDEKSFVVTLKTTTRDPQKSVAVAKGIVDAFKNELAKADADGAGRTADDLARRLTELKDQVTAAEAATERFRAEHNLQVSGGELVSTLSMTQLNNQLTDARQRLIEAKARYEELTQGSKAQTATAAAQESATLTALRSQLADLTQQADSISQTLGPKHPNYLAIQPQVAALETEVKAEIARIVEASKADYEQAKAVVSMLELDAEAAQSVVATGNEAQVQLRELERNAASQAAIYEAFLARAGQMAEREQINTTNIRVISEPVPPRNRSWPPPTVAMMALGAAAGLALGAMMALGLGITGWRLPRMRRAG